MGRWVIVNNNNVVDNVIVADLTFVDTVMRPQGFVCNEVAEDVRVAPGFYWDGYHYNEPTSCKLNVSGSMLTNEPITLSLTLLPWGNGTVSFVDNSGTELFNDSINGSVYNWVSNFALGSYKIKALFSGIGFKSSESDYVEFDIQ